MTFPTFVGKVGNPLILGGGLVRGHWLIVREIGVGKWCLKRGVWCNGVVVGWVSVGGWM